MHRYLPSPSASVVHLSFLTIHFYALCILLGILFAIAIVRARFISIGGDPDEITTLALWVIPAGIIGGRIYHVATSPDAYFGRGGVPLNAFKIWEGGMGIWGAIALGAVVARSVHSRTSSTISFAQLADVIAPALLVAQSIGRWGNWFNIELFGKPSTLPWALEVPAYARPVGFEAFQTFQPTFLYESLWCAIGALLLIRIKKFSAGSPGSLFLIYIIYYCVGRVWVEYLRIDPAHHLAGIRLNLWVSLVGLSVAILQLRRINKSPR